VLSSASRYYLWLEPVDMRKSFNGLQGIVTNQLRRDALSGEVFIFINRRRDQVKMLVWDLSIPEHIERVDEIIEPQEDTLPE
jgi:transposase